MQTDPINYKIMRLRVTGVQSSAFISSYWYVPTASVSARHRAAA